MRSCPGVSMASARRSCGVRAAVRPIREWQGARGRDRGTQSGCANLTRQIGRFLAMVAHLRTLFLALLVTVVALPDGFTVCLRQLGGGGIERDCCATCRTRESD